MVFWNVAPVLEYSMQKDVGKYNKNIKAIQNEKEMTETWGRSGSYAGDDPFSEGRGEMGSSATMSDSLMLYGSNAMRDINSPDPGHPSCPRCAKRSYACRLHLPV